MDKNKCKRKLKKKKGGDTKIKLYWKHIFKKLVKKNESLCSVVQTENKTYFKLKLLNFSILNPFEFWHLDIIIYRNRK